HVIRQAGIATTPKKIEATTDQQLAFEALKEKLTTAFMLAYSDFSQTFILFTNTSDQALGTVLVQNDNAYYKRVISYTSHSLTLAEKNYSVTEKECLAVVWA
ncbi:26078_t:CDS:2, partial [Racocetra persica]